MEVLVSELQSLREQVSDVVSGLGYSVVDVNQSVVKGRTHVHLVIYRREGVNVDDCAEIHKTVAPRLELLLDDRDVALQVASPGIDRTFKSNREFAVFVNRGVKVLLKSSMEWTSGIVASSDETSVTLESDGTSAHIPFSDIQKAKLDYTQEVR
jgi:ribosome maturation factor RimP